MGGLEKYRLLRVYSFGTTATAATTAAGDKLYLALTPLLTLWLTHGVYKTKKAKPKRGLIGLGVKIGILQKIYRTKRPLTIWRVEQVARHPPKTGPCGFLAPIQM